ncbi:hypothetical protein NFI96_031461, partial [Prochilodus magdalenae]
MPPEYTELTEVYPLTQAEDQAFEEYIREALAQGYIRPSTSPAAAGFFFIKKKDRGLRPCIDYRGLNAITKQYAYPLPLIPVALEQLRGATVFTKLDLRSTYNLVRPGEWPYWKQRFVRFRTATKLDKEDGAVQVSSLIYALGSESENIYRSFAFDEEGQRNDFERVLTKFDEYFVPRRNVIHERACFHQRVQRPGEEAETFIRALYELSEHCDFGASRDENIRDRIVVGILDKHVSRRLQLMKDLTLALMIETVRQSEEVASQVSMQGEATGMIHEITHKRSKYTKHYGWPGRGGGPLLTHAFGLALLAGPWLGRLPHEVGRRGAFLCVELCGLWSHVLASGSRCWYVRSATLWS